MKPRLDPIAVLLALVAILLMFSAALTLAACGPVDQPPPPAPTQTHKQDRSQLKVKVMQGHKGVDSPKMKVYK